MPFELHPLALSEVKYYPRVVEAAFVPGLLELLYPNGLSDEDQSHMAASLARGITRHPEVHRVLKVIDTDLAEDDPFGRIVGVSSWRIVSQARSPEDLKREEEEGEADEKEFGRPPGMDRKVWDLFHGFTVDARKKHIGDRAHILLQVIATRPEHFRRGVGALSLAWGNELADQMGLPCFLEASPMGAPLYQKMGYVTVETLPWDARDFGHGSALTHLVMRRPPKGEGVTSAVRS